MTPEEARKVARQHLGDTLTTLMRGGPHGDDWVVYAFACGTEASAHAPTVDAAAADCAAQLRASGWEPSHARLEWRPSAGKDYALVYRHEGLTLPMYRVFSSSSPDDFGAESLTSGTSAYGSLDFVLSEIAAHCASRIPSLHLPPFPGADNA